MTKARDLANAGTALTAVSATELGYLDGVTSAVQTQINAQIPKSTVTAKGDLLVATSSGTVVAQAVGSNGQVLTANSAQADGVEWTTLPASGKVLQVVQATYTTEVSNSTNTYTDTGLSATITPSSATSKILVMVSQNGCSKSQGNSLNAIQLRLNRGATTINDFARFGLLTDTTLRQTAVSYSVNYLDSPATTSATTYKTQFNCQNNTATVYVQQFGTNTSTITLLEIGA
jgi:hypothetical protein